MKRILIGAALSLGLIAGSQAQEKHVRPATAKEIALIKVAMEDRLKDPDSAKFKDVAVALKPDETGMRMACGWVNSKNSFGGYVGFSTFVSFLLNDASGKSLAVVLAVDSDEDGPAAKMCLEKLFGEKA